jgi:serine phosphatase RsbU (regulator of sigma subunit)
MPGRWWWIGGAFAIVIAVIAGAARPESDVADVFYALSVLWAIISGLLVLRRFWRWMTYRVGTRLFITYLLIGVLPLLFATAFAGIGLYVLMGQYTSVRFGTELEKLESTLSGDCEAVLDIASVSGTDTAFSLLEKMAADPPSPLSKVIWWARIDGESTASSDETDGLDFDWLPQGISRQIAHRDEMTYSLAAKRQPSGNRVVALIPFDEDNEAALSSHWWFDVAFLDLHDERGESPEDVDAEAAESVDGGSGRGRVRVSDDGVSIDDSGLWTDWAEEREGLLSRPFVIWFRSAADVVDLGSGEVESDTTEIALVRTSPQNVWRDFTLFRYELRTELRNALTGLGILFLVGYGLALTAAATVVLSIARSTWRLTQGARQVERGNLDHRVPVKRKDQLGDLAESFNLMTDSVQSMLADVAEKEHLARELELAREIQESLLPSSHLEMGPVTVRATFRPAAEVGGDYFDVFPLSADQLVVAIGDVAGHGLSTGLLMASLKSTVAALVHEGYGGSELIQKVNHLLMGDGHHRTMITLAVVEIDLEEDRLTLANAGHCPALLVGPEGPPDELAVSSLPIGSRLCRPASVDHPFPIGHRLVLYSDGLVEALSPAGEQYGYDRLEGTVAGAENRSGEGLTAEILESLAAHVDEVALADDLTILIVERN